MEQLDLILLNNIVKEIIYLFYVASLLHFSSRFKSKHAVSSGVSLGSLLSVKWKTKLPLSWLHLYLILMLFCVYR